VDWIEGGYLRAGAFGTVAEEYDNAELFRNAVLNLEAQGLLERSLTDDTAAQAWRLAEIAWRKAKLTQIAYGGAFVFLFLLLWPLARLMYAFAT